MKLLVTGANGLLGSAICKADSAYDIIPIPLTRNECDLTNFQDTKAIFKYIKPDYVIHTAAIVGGIGSNMNHPGKYFCDNIVINTNVLESARIVGVKQLVSYMSTCVFPDNAPFPLNERDIHSGEPHPSNAAYAYAKRMLDIQSKAYRSEYGCNFVTLVPANIYGKYDNFDLENGHVLSSLIHRCYLAKAHKKDFVVWGTGKPLREFIYSEDIAKISLDALEHYNEADPLIVSSGVEISIRDVVDIIVDLLDFKNKVIFDDSKPDGQFRKPSDTTKFNTYFPDYKFISIRDGLRSTIDWFLANYVTARGVDWTNLIDPYLQTR